QRPCVEADHLLHEPLHRVAIVDDDVPKSRQSGRPLIDAAEASIDQYVWMVGRQVARNKQRFVEIWLDDTLNGRRAQCVALHRQIADIVFVEFDLELLLKRLSVETRDLAEDLVYLPGQDTVIDDEVEADLGQRKPKFLSRAVDRSRSVGQVRAEIENRNNFCIAQPILPACLAHDRAATT